MRSRSRTAPAASFCVSVRLRQRVAAGYHSFVSELLPVLQSLLTEAQAGRPSALCTVVRTRGSTPQAAGATMLLRADFSTSGTLGGGCVEAEVRRRAFELLQRRQSAMLDFLLDHDYGWDDGLICGGRMEIAVMPIEPGHDLAVFRAAVEAALRREPAEFPIEVQQESGRRRFVVSVETPPTLLIAGAGHVGLALARLAADLDFHVTVIDDRADYASPERFGPRVDLVVGDIADTLRRWKIDAGCFVVIVTRGHQHDHEALDAVVRGPAGYIGMIGSKRKRDMIFRDLAAAGVTPEQIARVRSPIGLPIGAVTVPEIAVSIAAQLVAARRIGADERKSTGRAAVMVREVPAPAA